MSLRAVIIRRFKRLDAQNMKRIKKVHEYLITLYIRLLILRLQTIAK